MNTKALLALLFLTLVACERINISGIEDVVEPSFDIEVPADFNWEIHKSVNVSITIADQYHGRFDYGVEIYDGSELLEKGFVKGGEVFYTTVDIKKTCDYLTVVQIDPNTDKVIESIPISGSSIMLDFSDIQNSFTKSSFNDNIEIPSNAIQVPFTGKLRKGNVYVIDRPIKNLNNVDDVTLYVAPGVTYQILEKNEWKDSDIYICPGAKLVGTTTEEDFENVKIYNYGQVNIHGDLNFVGGAFINYSEAFVYNMTLSDEAKLETHGLLMVGVIVPADANPSPDSDKFGELELEDTEVLVGENGLLRVTSMESKDGKIELEAHAWIWADEDVECEETEIENTSKTDKYAVILAGGELSIDRKKDIEGKIVLDIEDDIDVDNSDGSWDVNVKVGNPGADVVSIPSTAYIILNYNDGGYNPKDPSELPKPTEIVYFEPTYTILMEDAYPYIGDMDMNDIVCEWQLGTLKDDNGKVTKLGLNYTVKAIGATRELAAAVALTGIDKANIKKVTLSKQHNFGQYFNINNVGIESGNTDDLVIPLFEDAHATCFGESQAKFINTFKTTTAYYNFKVEIELITPIERTKISRADINFFIVLNGDLNKRTEVHLYGNSPTAKASNQNADFTNNNVVWGIEQVKDFAYPKELISINKAYLGFESWVKSGGIENQDWYKYPVEGKVLK